MQRTLQGHRAHEFVEFLYSVAVVALALLGMGGVVYHILAPEGAIHPWLAGLWNSHPTMVTLVLVGFLTMVAASRSKPSRSSAFLGRTDLPLYVFVGLGTLFVARWLLNGAL